MDVKKKKKTMVLYLFCTIAVLKHMSLNENKVQFRKSVIVSFTQKEIQIFVCISSWRTKGVQHLGQRAAESLNCASEAQAWQKKKSRRKMVQLLLLIPPQILHIRQTAHLHTGRGLQHQQWLGKRSTDAQHNTSVAWFLHSDMKTTQKRV